MSRLRLDGHARPTPPSFPVHSDTEEDLEIAILPYSSPGEELCREALPLPHASTLPSIPTRGVPDEENGAVSLRTEVTFDALASTSPRTLRSRPPLPTHPTPHAHIPLSRIHGAAPRPSRLWGLLTTLAALLFCPVIASWRLLCYLLACLHPAEHEMLPREPMPWHSHTSDRTIPQTGTERKPAFWSSTLERYETFSSVPSAARDATDSAGERFREWRVRNRPALAEFAGSTLVGLAGFGATVRLTLLHPLTDSYVALKTVWGISTIVGLYITGGVSEGHMNPVVTFAYALRGRFPWPRVPAYLLAQLVGYLLGAALVLWLHMPELRHADPTLSVYGPAQTVTLFITAPAEGRGHGDEFLWETVASAAMALNSLACADVRNGWRPDPGLKPFALGMGVIAIRVALGGGYALNPARDLGPRILTAMAYGGDAFTRDDNYFWVPLLAPVLGAVLGTAFYAVFVLH